MKKLYLFSALIIALCSCSHKPAYQMVKPLPSAYEIGKQKDASVAASFSYKDFSWKDGKLSMNLFSEDLYNATEISELKAGDTLVYTGQPIIVKDVVFKDSFVTVNGGIEEGGADLRAKQGGTYRGTQLDDHSTYTELGKATVPLAKDFILVDCGENPTDPYDTIKARQEDYLKKLPDYKKTFSSLDTKVTIKNGVIVSITRKWIP